VGKVVERKPLKWYEELYLPAIVSGLARTFRQMFQPDITLQYPEQRPEIQDNYRGAPGPVKDELGREKCVSCQLCEFICPPRAILIVPGEIREAAADETAGPDNVEKAPKEFYIDMLRCIYCGYCEEVCPEEAIFMTRVTSISARTREEMVWNKEQLLAVGGVRPGVTKRWNRLMAEAARQGVPHGELRRPEGAEAKH
jgi:NADH-quinone oxidoreductase subunit I